MAKTKKAPKKVAKKTAKTDTHIVFILDKSGSMSTCEAATISGFNEYVGTLKKDKKVNYTMSLTLFDTEVTQRYKNTLLSRVADLDKEQYKPDGSTALYDAVCGTLATAEKTLKGGKVLVVIMTDGEENASKEYDDKDMRKKIKDLEATGRYSFVYLGANQDSYLVGKKFGLAQQNIANFNATGAGVAMTMRTMATNTVGWAGQGAEMNTSAFFSKADQKNLGDTK